MYGLKAQAAKEVGGKKEFHKLAIL